MSRSLNEKKRRIIITRRRANSFLRLRDQKPPFVPDVICSLKKITNLINKVIRIRRASDNSEIDISFANDGSMDELAVKNFGGSSDCFVTTWYNQVGGDNHAKQEIANLHHKIYDGYSGDLIRQNNKPALVFNRKVLTLAKYPLFSNTNGLSAYAVCTQAVRGQDGNTIVGQYGFNNSRSHRLEPNRATVQSNPGGFDSSEATSTNRFRVEAGIAIFDMKWRPSTKVSIFRNNVLRDTADVAVDQLPIVDIPNVIGGVVDSSGESFTSFFNGTIQEIRVFNRVLSDQENTDLINDLNNYYNIF